ncbi:3031_t:CDS:1, partial [Racocetra fulgida]
ELDKIIAEENLITSNININEPELDYIEFNEFENNELELDYIELDENENILDDSEIIYEN